MMLRATIEGRQNQLADRATAGRCWIPELARARPEFDHFLGRDDGSEVVAGSPQAELADEYFAVRALQADPLDRAVGQRDHLFDEAGAGFQIRHLQDARGREGCQYAVSDRSGHLSGRHRFRPAAPPPAP